MAHFSYKALDKNGRQVTGDAETTDRKRLLQQLTQKGLRPISVEFLGEQVSSDEGVEQLDFFKKSSGKRRLFSARRSKKAVALEFLKRLHVLLASGMSIGDAVSLLGKRLTAEECRDIYRNVD